MNRLPWSGRTEIAPGLWRIRAGVVAFFLLRDAGGIGLIDTGWLGARAQIRSALVELGSSWSEVNLVLLTHGHIDHTGNAHWIQQQSSAARLLVHVADTAHVRTGHPYRGLSRVCGLLETMARPVAGFQPPQIHGHFADGEVIPRFGGLRVVHLPGHTAGHCGFVHEASGLLICGDLFSTTLGLFHWPPAVLNSEPAQLAATRTRAAALPVRGFLPSHCDDAAPETQRARFLAAFRA